MVRAVFELHEGLADNPTRPACAQSLSGDFDTSGKESHLVRTGEMLFERSIQGDRAKWWAVFLV